MPPADESPTTRLAPLLERTLNHDLPNMVVALKGMLQMLEQDEGERLGTAGKEYLTRLAAITHRLQSTVTTLRAINKVSQHLAPAETIRLGELLREAATASKSSLPNRRLHFHSVLHEKQIWAPRYLVQQAVTELFQVLGQSADAGDVHFYIASRAAGKVVELTVGNGPVESAFTSQDPALAPDSPSCEAQSVDVEYLQYLEPEWQLKLILVGELARAWGGRLQARVGAGCVFTLTLPPGDVA